MTQQYSQHAEQEVIAAYFAKRQLPGRPRLLDIGAANGKTFSNTRALLEQGWGGTLVEASPFLFPKLLESVSELEAAADVVCVNAAIAKEDGLQVWYDCGGDMVSTMDPEHRRLWETQVKFTSFFIATVSFPTLLKACPGPYEFVSIDVEGTNLQVLESMPAAWGPQLLCVEYSPTVAGERQSMEALMRARGYRPLLEIGPNLFFERQGLQGQ